MATITYEVNTGSIGTPTWTSVGANTLVFSGSAATISTPIATTGWNDGTHYGNGDPGTDQCAGGPNSSHPNNVKYVDGTHFILNAGSSEVLNDTNLIAGECSLRLHLNNGASVQTQNTKFFSFDGTTDTNEAVGIECYAFEQGVSASAWTQINDDSANIGGNNTSEFLDLAEKGPGTDLYWYLALSARGESAGAKTSFDFKIVTEIF